MISRCPFCLSNRSGKQATLLENRSAYFLRSLDPVLRCSGMIIPFRHVAAVFDLTQNEWLDTFDLVNRAKLLLDVEGPQGYNVGWNIGQVAGQTVPHVHLHIIGRFSDEPFAGQGIRHHLKHEENRRRTRR
ncbi:HIT domain-containing protein (plasmid) [Rhizobium sp. CB3090]|uniref:HIT family protein n=1 Tax=Rhizobium sp. CB3090 TaxID=3039156 RepID=UPI0024B13DE9|nr:HIT domain-containing protein [Rhizobium sp. CB3090]WFU12201.1 HIT domain-containing protein [Rhizobium sp. CB3090]